MDFGKRVPVASINEGVPEDSAHNRSLAALASYAHDLEQSRAITPRQPARVERRMQPGDWRKALFGALTILAVILSRGYGVNEAITRARAAIAENSRVAPFRVTTLDGFSASRSFCGHYKSPDGIFRFYSSIHNGVTVERASHPWATADGERGRLNRDFRSCEYSWVSKLSWIDQPAAALVVALRG